MKRAGIQQITPKLWRGAAVDKWTPIQRERAIEEFIWCCDKVGDDELEVVEIGAQMGLHLEAVGRPGLKGSTPLHLAMGSGAVRAQDILIDAGGLLEVCGPDGNTPLAIASWAGSTELARALLAAGAEVDAACQDGWTPLMRACSSGAASCAQELIRAGARLDAENVEGLSVRTIAARRGGGVAELVEKEAARCDALALEAAAGPSAGSSSARKMSL